MKKKDWRYKIKARNYGNMSASNSKPFSETVVEDCWYIREDEVVERIQQEIDRAREEGYKEGVQDGMKGKVFEKIEIDTEVRFSDLKDVIDGKEDAGEFLDKLTK